MIVRITPLVPGCSLIIILKIRFGVIERDITDDLADYIDIVGNFTIFHPCPEDIGKNPSEVLVPE